MISGFLHWGRGWMLVPETKTENRKYKYWGKIMGPVLDMMLYLLRGTVEQGVRNENL